ncbi:restriction endonuclease subunit S [Aeromonas enteropelogenes]|uniref:restriction endonuclease subunit S n=1 Tax=Aeromonas enteropelogenes TaxID=29489 RepID=UPI00398817DF
MKKGWVTKTLGDILERTETTNPTNEPDSEFHYIDVSSVSNITFSVETTQTLKGKDTPSRARKLVRENDVLFATIRPTLKRIAIVPKELDQQVCSTGYFVLRAKPEVDHRFLFYSLFTASFMGQMESLQKGASYPAVTEGEVKAQSFSFPPLPEQQRIVAILDEAFEAIAAARANAEQNRQNSRALFESYLQSVFSQRGEGWVEKSLEELGTITSSKRIFKSEYVSAGTPFYRTKEIKELANGRTISTELFISEDRYKDIKSNFGVPEKGDILLTAIGTIGEVWVVDGNSDFYFKDGNVLWFKNFDSIVPTFLKYVLESFVESLNRMSHGSAYNALPIQRLKTHKIYLPSIIEQEQIVKSLVTLRNETQRLESIYQRKIAALDELKQSLLQQAFSGQL